MIPVLRERPRFYRFCPRVANKFLRGLKLLVCGDLRKFRRMRCAPLFVPGRAPQLRYQQSITSASSTLANAVGVNGCTATASESADSSAFLPPGDAADKSTRANPSRSSQFIAMFLPETSAVLVAIADACVVRVGDIAMPMAQPAAGSC